MYGQAHDPLVKVAVKARKSPEEMLEYKGFASMVKEVEDKLKDRAFFLAFLPSTALLYLAFAVLCWHMVG